LGIRGILNIDTSLNIVIAGVFIGIAQDTPAGYGVVSIGDLATILTVAGVAIYVLGLGGLAVTIRIRLAKDIPTAWYAVSLLPRTLVAGQGLRIWLGWPIGLTVAITLGIILMKSFELDGDTALKTVRSSVIFVVMLYLTVWVVRLWRSDRPYPQNLPFARNRKRALARFAASSLMYILYVLWGVLSAAAIAVGSAIIAAAGLLIMRALGFDSDLGLDMFFTVPSRLADVVPRNHSGLVGAIILFVGGFIIGIPSALLMKPPLPQVQLTKKEGYVTSVLPSSMTYNLVTHSSDGLWHVFDDTRRLWSIPDNEVLLAQIAGGSTTTPVAQGRPAGDEEVGKEE
jgi:hypothetical protein